MIEVMAPADKGALKNATFRVPRNVWQRAKKRAIDEERSLNDVIVKALESYAGVEPGGQPPLASFLSLARAVTSRQRKDRPSRTFTKDELHERGR
jgi:hypothetical protein